MGEITPRKTGVEVFGPPYPTGGPPLHVECDGVTAYISPRDGALVFSDGEGLRAQLMRISPRHAPEFIKAICVMLGEVQ